MKVKEAYVFLNGGIIHIIEYPSQRPICSSASFQRATRKARLMGFNVRVYCDFGYPDEEDVRRRKRFGVRNRDLHSTGSYILPRVKP